MTLYCIPTCSTCEAARKWLKARGYTFTEYNLKETVPAPEDMKQWIATSGLDMKRFFNTSGLKYKELGLSKKLAELDDAQKLEILLSDGMLMKRPLLIDGDTILLGFKQEQWERVL